MKILYIITQSELGGAQKNALDLAYGLKDKYKILVAAGIDGGGDFFQALEKKNISYLKLRWLRRDANNPLADLIGLWEIFKLIKKEKPDIVHLHSSKAGFSGSLAAKLSGIKVVYTVHGAVFEAPFSLANRKFYFWLEKFSARFKDKIICVSENDRRLWLKYNAAPAQKLVVVRNGIDLSIPFLPKDQAREDLFGLSSPLYEACRGSKADLKIVGAIANFYPEKGLTFFIKAAELLLKENKLKNVIFTLIGDGLERELLEEMIRAGGLEGKFVLAGRVAGAARYISAFDIFVLPSVKEGLPYTILEAMAAGLPIVASYVGGIPEMVKNEENGFLVLPKNPEMLAEKITKLLEDPALSENFARNSQLKIKEFSLEKMVGETEKIYENI